MDGARIGLAACQPRWGASIRARRSTKLEGALYGTSLPPPHPVFRKSVQRMLHGKSARSSLIAAPLIGWIGTETVKPSSLARRHLGRVGYLGATTVSVKLPSAFS